MKIKTILTLVLCSSMLVVACGDDDDTGTTPPPNPTGVPTAPPPPPTGNPPPPPANPPVPTVGAQIDRMGRPAANTAANNTFNPDAATKNAAKDAYNAEADPTKWAPFVPEIEKNLAILDSLDTVCGNQIFADTGKTDPSRYATFASVLADDRLWVKTDAATCTTYLAVEANATAILPNEDCGGRKPAYDVIDQSYNLLALGTVTGAATDGADPDPAKTGVATFPYLAPAQ